MGLDMYLITESQLSKGSAKQGKLIEYLNTHVKPKFKEDQFELYLSNYDEDTKSIRRHINSLKLYGQIGEVEAVSWDRETDTWSVQAESVYWRKANQVHNWFVQTVQNEVDDCGKYEVSIAQLEQLVDDCSIALNNPTAAQKVLPTRQGFFFGNTEYGSYYKDQTKRTLKTVKKLLRPSTVKNWKFYYSSSW